MAMDIGHYHTFYFIILYSAYDVTIPAEGKALLKTDIAVAIPEGCYGRVGKLSFMSQVDGDKHDVIWGEHWPVADHS